jgi:hypothetical protein
LVRACSPATGCSKSSLLAAKAELFQQAKDVKEHAGGSAQGIKEKGQSVRELEGVKRLASGADAAIKTAKSLSNTVYRKTSSTVTQLTEPEIRIDVEVEAGFDLVHHYSGQFSRLHVHTTKNAAAANRAADMIAVHTNDIRQLQARFTSVQAELIALPNVMTQLSNQVETIYKLRDGLHELEAQLGDLETLCDKVDVHRADLTAKRKRAEYQRHANHALHLQQADFVSKVRTEHSERNKPLASRLKESMQQFAGEVLAQRAVTGSPSPADGSSAAAALIPAAEDASGGEAEATGGEAVVETEEPSSPSAANDKEAESNTDEAGSAVEGGGEAQEAVEHDGGDNANVTASVDVPTAGAADGDVPAPPDEEGTPTDGDDSQKKKKKKKK